MGGKSSSKDSLYHSPMPQHSFITMIEVVIVHGFNVIQRLSSHYHGRRYGGYSYQSLLKESSRRTKLKDSTVVFVGDALVSP